MSPPTGKTMLADVPCQALLSVEVCDVNGKSDHGRTCPEHEARTRWATRERRSCANSCNRAKSSHRRGVAGAWWSIRHRRWTSASREHPSRRQRCAADELDRLSCARRRPRGLRRCSSEAPWLTGGVPISFQDQGCASLETSRCLGCVSKVKNDASRMAMLDVVPQALF